MNDSRFPWLILIPRRADITELHQLNAADRGLLMEEIAQAAQTLEALFTPDKINIGALGNIVQQLHVHIIARMRTDPAWPGPVWGSEPRAAYHVSQLTSRQAALRQALSARGSVTDNEPGY